MRILTAASLGGLPIQLDPNARDYASILSALIRHVQALIPEWTDFDPGDPGVGILEANAFLGDTLNYNIDRGENEAYLPTAQRRSSVVDLLRLINYELSPRSSASVDLTVVTDQPNVPIPASTRVASTASPNTSSQVYEILNAENLVVAGEHVVTAVHGETVGPEAAGVSNGSPRQSFRLSRYPLTVFAALPPLTVTVGGNPWAAADGGTGRSFLGANPDDEVFIWRLDSNGRPTLQFGDGVNGAIPPDGQAVEATYRIGGGLVGNQVGKNTLINPPSIPGIVSVTNLLQPSGGTDAETIDHARNFGPLSLRANDRAVTLEDYATLAMLVPGVRLARAAHVDSPFSVHTFIMAEGDNPIPSGKWFPEIAAGFGMLGSVGRYLEARKCAPTQVFVEGPTLVRPYLRADVYALPNMLRADTKFSVEKNLVALFRNLAQQFEAAVPLSRVIQVIENTRGVDWVNVLEFHRLPKMRYKMGRELAFEQATFALGSITRTTDEAFYELRWKTDTTFTLHSSRHGRVLDKTRQLHVFTEGVEGQVNVYRHGNLDTERERTPQFNILVTIGATRPNPGDVWTFGVDHYLGNIATRQFEVVLPTILGGDRLSPNEFLMNYAGGIGA